MSEDALLLQVSSISEKLAVEFADGVTETVPASYIEFVQRLTLPEFKDMPQDEVRRDSHSLLSFIVLSLISISVCDADQRVS